MKSKIYVVYLYAYDSDRMKNEYEFFSDEKKAEKRAKELNKELSEKFDLSDNNSPDWICRNLTEFAEMIECYAPNQFDYIKFLIKLDEFLGK